MSEHTQLCAGVCRVAALIIRAELGGCRAGPGGPATPLGGGWTLGTAWAVGNGRTSSYPGRAGKCVRTVDLENLLDAELGSLPYMVRAAAWVARAGV